MTLFVVAAALVHNPLLGPDPASIFAGWAGDLLFCPVLAIAAALVGYAIRERSERFALAGGLTLNLAVTAAYLLTIAKSGLRFDLAQWAKVGAAQRDRRGRVRTGLVRRLSWTARRKSIPWPPVGQLLVNQLSIAISLIALVLGPTWCAIVWYPQLSAELSAVVQPWGVVAVLLTAAFWESLGKAAGWRHSSSRLLCQAMARGRCWPVPGAATEAPLGSVALSRRLARRHAGGFGGRLCDRRPQAPLADPLAAAIDRPGERRRFGRGSGPRGRWPATRRRRGGRSGRSCVVSAAVTWLACWSLLAGLLYYAAICTSAAVTAWSIWVGSSWLAIAPAQRLAGLLQINILALGAAAVVSVLLERHMFGPSDELSATDV